MGLLESFCGIENAGFQHGIAREFSQQGLTISEEQIAELSARRVEVLRDLGRVELGAGALPLIAERLAQSSYARQETLADDLAEIQDAFYSLRDDIPASVPDSDILDSIMVRFNQTGGSVEEACALSAGDVLHAIEAASVDELQEDVFDACDSPLIDEQGRAYQRLRNQWDAGEQCCGWDGEEWAEGSVR